MANQERRLFKGGQGRSADDVELNGRQISCVVMFLIVVLAAAMIAVFVMHADLPRHETEKVEGAAAD